MSLKCKYCEKSLDNQVYYLQENTQEYNCEACEIVCRIAVDMISKGIHFIGKPQPERSKREDIDIEIDHKCTWNSTCRDVNRSC